MFERNHLLETRDHNDNPNTYTYLADLIATLGPPPPEFLSRNPDLRDELWDEQGIIYQEKRIVSSIPAYPIVTGKWIPSEPIPENRTLESRKTKAEDKKAVFRFLRRALAWKPEDRPTAKELMGDPWLIIDEAEYYVHKPSHCIEYRNNLYSYP